MRKHTHKWGPWGLPKPNDFGQLLQYRRCKTCNELEGRTAYWNAVVDRISINPTIGKSIAMSGLAISELKRAALAAEKWAAKIDAQTVKDYARKK